MTRPTHGSGSRCTNTESYRRAKPPDLSYSFPLTDIPIPGILLPHLVPLDTDPVIEAGGAALPPFANHSQMQNAAAHLVPEIKTGLIIVGITPRAVFRE